MPSARLSLAAWRGVLGDDPTVGPSPHRDTLHLVTARTGRRYYLKRIGQWRKGASLADEFRVLCHLRAAGLPVAVPEIADDGRLWTGAADDSTILLPERPGAQIAHETDPDAERICTRIGATIARLHRGLASYPHALTTSYHHDMDLGEAAKCSPPGLWDETAGPLRNRIEPLLAGLPEQLVSGDLNSGNLLLARGSDGWEVTGLIDIDHLPTGPRLYDLAYYLSRQARFASGSAEHGERFLELVPRYVAGYRDVYPLTDRELAALPAAMVTAELGCTGWSQRLLDGVYGHDNDGQNAADVEVGSAGVRWLCASYDQLVAAVRSVA